MSLLKRKYLNELFETQDFHLATQTCHHLHMAALTPIRSTEDHLGKVKMVLGFHRALQEDHQEVHYQKEGGLPGRARPPGEQLLVRVSLGEDYRGKENRKADPIKITIGPTQSSLMTYKLTTMNTSAIIHVVLPYDLARGLPG